MKHQLTANSKSWGFSSVISSSFSSKKHIKYPRNEPNKKSTDTDKIW